MDNVSDIDHRFFGKRCFLHYYYYYFFLVSWQKKLSVVPNFVQRALQDSNSKKLRVFQFFYRFRDAILQRTFFQFCNDDGPDDEGPDASDSVFWDESFDALATDFSGERKRFSGTRMPIDQEQRHRCPAERGTTIENKNRK